MKRFVYTFAGLFAVASLASCSSDEEQTLGSGSEGIEISLRIPSDLNAKSTFGDQETVTLDNLQYSVYEIVDNEPELAFSTRRQAFGQGVYAENETVRLGKGKSYRIVFYADRRDNGFVTYSDGNISVDYSGIDSNEEKYDAFYAKTDVFFVDDEMKSLSVTLHRPFSQLNWGTSDFNEKSVIANHDNLTATVSIKKGLYKKMNLLDGSLSEPVDNTVVFRPTILDQQTPSQDFPYQPDNYKLIAMNYLLTGTGTLNCTLSFSNRFADVNVNNVNVQENYRTNIYGALFTNPIEFNIKVIPGFASDENVAVN